jgi:hypothetical protein
VDDSRGLRVECHAGHRADERPRRFFLEDRLVDVVAVIDRWLGPDHRYFKVKSADGDTYVLRHDTAADRWELTMFARTGTLGRLNR